MSLTSIKAIKAVIASFLTYILILGDAHAYIDPGSGSVIMTAILGAIAAVGYTIRKYFYKIKRFFSKDEPASEE